MTLITMYKAAKYGKRLPFLWYLEKLHLLNRYMFIMRRLSAWSTSQMHNAIAFHDVDS